MVKVGGGLGDVAISTLVLHALSRHGHNVEIIAKHNSGLLADCDFFNALHTKQDNDSYAQQLKMYTKLLKQKWDVTLNLLDNPVFNLFALLSSAKTKKSTKHMNSDLLNQGYALYTLSILDGVIDDWQDQIKSTITLKPERYINAYQKLEINEPANYLSVAPSSYREHKCWSLDNFSFVLNKLSDKFEYIIVVGSPEETKMCEQLAKSCNGINAAGKINLLETAAIVSNAKVHLGNDSGLGHVAACNKTPVLAIGGKSMYKPWQQHQLPGQVADISTNQVLAKLEELIEFA